MKTNIYAVKDVVAKEFGPAFSAKNDDVAIRMYWNLVKKHEVDSKDFELYSMGYYEDNDGDLLAGNFEPRKVVTDIQLDGEV